MRNITLDTTVLAKGIIPPRRRKEDSIYKKEYKLYTIAKSFLREVEGGEAKMNIPFVAAVEVAAVGARLTGKEERGIQASDYVKEYGNFIDEIYLLEEAIKIAAKTKISGFDSVFIACANITDSTLITDDRKMHNAAIKVGIEAKLLREMESGEKS